MKSYNPKSVSLIVDGRYIVGFMDGSFINTEKNEDNFKTHVGADGEVTTTEIADQTGKIVVTLKQTSSSLPYLQSKAKQTKPFAARVIDGNADTGKFKAGGNLCRILKTPGREYGDDVNGVEIEIFVADYDAV